ncbi:ASCH domain-containing protein [Haloechinothrix sp. YIM 98757]|uniref:ASCH domain-containing protein n=1 Tax=Haloechinothrix aidingensis TaxID=2752311 RepID=A0A838A930_9PSEU|nr:ASCH domain-containing protein [Haloechinothrix aidingensis]MBA0125397.1 ASCH domain-containing protein [Haloechinothrix aidingensis]
MTARPGGWGELPKAEFAFPGPLRDRLVELVLSGVKRSATGLLVEYGASGVPLPEIGARSVVVNSADDPVALMTTTGVRVVRLAEVDVRHVVDEGEGHSTVAEWRAAHEEFWSGPQMLEALADPDFHVDDDTLVVLERFVCAEIPRIHDVRPRA